jgi:hypothetical protein
MSSLEADKTKKNIFLRDRESNTGRQRDTYLFIQQFVKNEEK